LKNCWSNNAHKPERTFRFSCVFFRFFYRCLRIEDYRPPGGVSHGWFMAFHWVRVQCHPLGWHSSIPTRGRAWQPSCVDQVFAHDHILPQRSFVEQSAELVAYIWSY